MPKPRPRHETIFAILNLVPSAMLAVGLWQLPVRWLPADLVIGSAVVVLPVTSAVAVSRPVWSRPALRVASWILLVVGLLLVGAAVLSVAFLAGVHGDFGRGGVALMTLIAFLVLPYAVGYPALELWWLGPSRPASPEAPGPAADDARPESAGSSRGAVV